MNPIRFHPELLHHATARHLPTRGQPSEYRCRPRRSFAQRRRPHQHHQHHPRHAPHHDDTPPAVASGALKPRQHHRQRHKSNSTLIVMDDHTPRCAPPPAIQQRPIHQLARPRRQHIHEHIARQGHAEHTRAARRHPRPRQQQTIPYRPQPPLPWLATVYSPTSPAPDSPPPSKTSPADVPAARNTSIRYPADDALPTPTLAPIFSWRHHNTTRHLCYPVNPARHCLLPAPIQIAFPSPIFSGNMPA